jgi:ABC-type transport system involved in multi-copper enzyme maturation permease subunit
VTDWQVVLSKFFGALSFYCLLWAPTFIHFGIFKWIAKADAANANGAYMGVYLLLLLMGMFFTAYGCLASSLVKDQINAAVICACGVFIWFFLPFLPEIMRITKPETLEFFRYFSAAEHMREFAEGCHRFAPGGLVSQRDDSDAVPQLHRFPAPQVESLVATAHLNEYLFMAEETLTEAPKPAAKSPPPKTGISSGKRVVIGLNVIVQVLVVVIIVALVNFISFRRFVRWDISRDQKFALAPQTKNLLASLQKPVTAIVYFAGGGAAGQIAPDVMALLKEYEYASKQKLTVETVDPYRISHELRSSRRSIISRAKKTSWFSTTTVNRSS